MNLDTRCYLLNSIYEIFDNFSSDLDIKCHKTCAACCTCNVTLTTLEGLVILRHLEANRRTDLFTRVVAALQEPHFQPRVTINQLADLCAQGKDLPEEAADPNVGACPLLMKDICALYDIRPFGCRAMISQTDCRQTGVADMPDFVLTLNNVFSQYIESIDAQGLFGNLIDILAFLAVPEQRKAYEARQIIHPPPGLPVNRRLSVLMVPPEHQERFQPLLQAVHRAIQKFA